MDASKSNSGKNPIELLCLKIPKRQKSQDQTEGWKEPKSLKVVELKPLEVMELEPL